jgi:hypothetical protein
MGAFVTKVDQLTQHTGQLTGHIGTLHNQYQQLIGRQGYPPGPYLQQGRQPQHIMGRADDYMPPPYFDTEEFDIQGADESGLPWKAIGIVIAIVILLVILVRFARSERLVSNSPQLLSHENVELQEYSYYVPKLKLPYMFF